MALRVLPVIQHKTEEALPELPVYQGKEQRPVRDHEVIGPHLLRQKNGRIKRQKKKTDHLRQKLAQCENRRVFCQFFSASHQLASFQKQFAFSYFPFKKQCRHLHGSIVLPPVVVFL